MFKISPSQKYIKTYYSELEDYKRLSLTHEGTVKIAFQHLLETIARQKKWILTQENTIKSKNIRLDGVLFDTANLPRGYWEAKDIKDNLPKEVQKKLYDKKYPSDNLIFQNPVRAILYQNGCEVLDVDLREPEKLVKILDAFFNFQRPEYDRWDLAADEFRLKVPKLAEKLLILIQDNADDAFKTAFDHFAVQCKQAINPNLSDAAIEEMLIQHLLTERIFRNIFKNATLLREKLKL